VVDRSVGATLALAIGANTAIFSIVNGVLLRPLGYGDDSRLVVLWATTGADGSNLFRLSPADYRDLREGADAFGGQVALYRSIGSTLTGLDQPAQVGSLTVTARVFSVLDATPALGRFYTDEDEDPGSGKKVVITHASWTRRFGSDPDIIGSTIELDSMPYTVVAVTEPGFQFPPGDEKMELYFPMGLTDNILLERDHRMFDAIARLDDGVTLESARAELGAMAAQLAREFPDTNRGWSMTAEPIRRELLGDLGPMLWVLSGAVLLVLLTACANIANVLVARSTAASREFCGRWPKACCWVSSAASAASCWPSGGRRFCAASCRPRSRGSARSVSTGWCWWSPLSCPSVRRSCSDPCRRCAAWRLICTSCSSRPACPVPLPAAGSGCAS